ncbi:Uncharacterized protein NCS13_1_0275 [Neochlamydia sp. S13]|nr:Uncharacterized protein NCS13_1_0275 [Neochlamydia sp. S13]
MRLESVVAKLFKPLIHKRLEKIESKKDEEDTSCRLNKNLKNEAKILKKTDLQRFYKKLKRKDIKAFELFLGKINLYLYER